MAFFIFQQFALSQIIRIWVYVVWLIKDLI